jgi:SAM-dependent methyltransferase
MPSSDFPRLFEAQYSDYDEDLPFWLSLASAVDGPALELGCGPGRVLLALARAGKTVDGLDNDSAMLDRARRHLTPDLAGRVRLHLADLRQFDLGRTFALALLPCSTFAHLTDADAASALAAIRRHLLLGGTLAIELPHPAESLFPGEKEDEPILAYLEPESGNPVQVDASQRFDSDLQRVDVTWHYDELLDDGRVLRTDIAASYFLRGPERMTSLLDAAGFPQAEFHGDYDRAPFAPDSPRLLVVARAG